MSTAGKWDPEVMRYYSEACKNFEEGSLPELVDADDQEPSASKLTKPKKSSPNKKRTANGSSKPLKKRRDASMRNDGDAGGSPEAKPDYAEAEAADGNSDASNDEKATKQEADEEAPQRQKKNAPWRKKKIEAFEREKAGASADTRPLSSSSTSAVAATAAPAAETTVTKKLRERAKMLPLFMLEQHEDDDLEYGDLDKLRDKIFEEEQDAAIEVGLLPAQLNLDERKELPIFARQPLRYIEIRNHIVKMWLEQKGRYLKKEDVITNIKPKYQAEVYAIHDYLVRAGYINVGFLPDRPPQEERKETVIVLGAGFAGLMAAYQLKCFGYRVTVVEARDRVGGRVRTSFLPQPSKVEPATPADSSSSLPIGVDLGAMVVTGTKGNPVALICQQLKHRLHVLASGCPIFDWRTGERVPADVDTKVEKQFNTILDIAAKMPPRVQTSLGKAVEQLISEANPGPLERSLFDWHVANLEYGCATELTPVSLQHWDQDDAYELGGDHCLLPAGYSSVAKHIATQLDVKLNTPVKSVSYSATGVQLSTADGQTLEADYCICTLPLGVLKANTVQFSPPLPPFKRAVVQRLGFGALNKIALLFSEVFWPDEEDYFGITSERSDLRGENFLFWNIHRCNGSPLLLALIAGKSALSIESESDEAIAERALAALRRVFKEKVTPLVKCEVTRWRSDPYSCGAYTYIAEGATGVDYDELALPLERLLFAGEATCREHPATVVGAALSGLREAARIERLVKGPIQTLGVPTTVEGAEEKEHSLLTQQRDLLMPDDDYYEPGSKKTKVTSRASSSLDELPSFRKGSAASSSGSAARPSFMPVTSPAPPPRATGKSLFSHSAPKVEDSLPPIPNLMPVFPTLKPLAPVTRSAYAPRQAPAAMSPPGQSYQQRPSSSAQPAPIPRQPTPYFLPAQQQPPMMGYPPQQQQPPVFNGYSMSQPPPLVAPPAYQQQQQPPPLSRPPPSDARPKTTRPAPPSPNSARKMRDEVSEVVVKRLQHFNRSGRIAEKEDFKRLARKLTHTVVEKESGRRTVDEALRRKIAQFVDRFFEKNPGVYAKASKLTTSGSSASSSSQLTSSASVPSSTSTTKPDSPVDDDMYIVT